MDSGKLSIVDSSSDELDSFYNELPGGDSPFETFAESIVVDDTIDLGRAGTAYKGRAALEDVEEIYDKEIQESGKIEIEKTLRKAVRTTEFILVPDSFMATQSSAGDFLIPMLNRNTEHAVFEAEIDLIGYVNQIEDPQFWKVGFEQRADGAENGVLHGTQVLGDSEIGDLLGDVQKNQIGIEHPLNDETAKSFATKSGYFELYQPNSDTKEFIQYLQDNIVYNLRMK